MATGPVLLGSDGVDALSAGARPVSAPAARMFSVNIVLGGALPAASRAEATEFITGALNALAEQLPGFVDCEAKVVVQLMPPGAA